MSRRQRIALCIVVVVAALVGVALLAYPAVAHWWNGMRQRDLINAYQQSLDEVDARQCEEELAAADAYNAELSKTGMQWDMSDDQMTAYNSLLNLDGAGMMGYLQIPKIDVDLAIYHGTSDDVLSMAVGHIAGTSLPVGGKGTHSCVSGHRGLPSPRLLTDIALLQEGDVFTITVLNRVLTYEVDQVRTVLPENLTNLTIDPQQDYVTIVTCTPFGVNTHRLLVRGHRVDSQTVPMQNATSDAPVRSRHMVALVAGLIIVALLVVLLLRRRQSPSEGE